MRAGRPGAASTILLSLLLAGCAGLMGANTGGAPAGGEALPAPAGPAWPVRTRYNVDLWLHGYAMITNDNTQIPYYKRGYRDRMLALEQKAGVSSKLLEQRDQLQSQLTATPQMAGGQFLPLYFDSWDSMQRGIDAFLRAGGDPTRAVDQPTQVQIAIIAASFPTAADRTWLRTFTLALMDEGTRFYQSYWNAQQRERSPIIVALDSLWTRTYLPRFSTFLHHSQQGQGELFLALPLDGEGRTVVTNAHTSEIAVDFPEAGGDPKDVIYVFAHEAMGAIAGRAVTDNTTPADQRSGAADRYSSPAAVRGGAMLLKRLAPELVQGYEQFYLQSAGVADTHGNNVDTLFEQTFALPAPIADAINRQITTVMSGI